MAARIIELKGSGDFTRGPGTIDGKGLAIVLDAADQDEAEALALAFFPVWVGGIPRASLQITDQGGGIFSVDVAYKNAVPGTAPSDAGKNQSNRPSNKDETKLTRDMTFTTGGGTRKKYTSINTRYRLAADPADGVPDFGGLIGVTKDGKVDGCEVIAPKADFTITQRFAYLSMGWFRGMLDTIATTNNVDWLGMFKGEVLFVGCDGNYKDGDNVAPWTVTGKFSYSRNYNQADSPDVAAALKVGDIQVPDVYGHEYVWVSYKKKTVTLDVAGGGTRQETIEFPRWVFVEQVYLESDFSKLGLDCL